MRNEILYISGYHSTYDTAKALVEIGKENGLIIHYVKYNDQNADEAVNTIKKYLSKNQNIGIIAGTSLGGFLTLQFNGYIKLVINPCLYPSYELPKIGCDEKIAMQYKKYEKRFIDNIDAEEKIVTYGLFGTKDELIHYGPEFERLFGKKNIKYMPGVKHRMDEYCIYKYFIPTIKHLLKNGKTISEAASTVYENQYILLD